MARPLRCGGGGSRRSKTCWMCSCGGWNWDWRTTCLGCGYAAPPWVLDAAAARARPQADQDGWVDQPRARRAQRQARGAAASAASTESQTSLGAKRAELGAAQRAAAEQKAPSLPRSTLLQNAISKGERRLRAARQSLEQKQAARDLAEAQLQKAQQELAQLDAELEEASRAFRALQEDARAEAPAQRRQRAAEWAGSSEVPGLFVQLDKLPEVEAVRTLLAQVSSEDGTHAGATGPWQPQRAAERGQAERRGDARGERPKVAQAFKRELVAEAPGQATTAALDVRRGLEVLGVNGNTWRRSLEVIEAFASRHGALPHLVMLQEARLALHRLEEARSAAHRMGYAAFLHAAAPTDKEGPLANSGGAATLVRSDLQAAESAWMAPSDLRHRMIGVTITTASGLQFLACSLHLQDALGPKGINLDIFAAFGDTVLSEGTPWLAQGDFNMEPGTLHELGWPRVQRGTYLGPAECTCVAQGDEHVYDWFVGSFCLAHGVREASVLDGFGLCPHKPVRLLLQDVRPDALVQVLVRTPPLGAHPLASGALQLDLGGSWEVGSQPSDACEAARQWIQVVESTVVGIHGIGDGDLPRYLGRSAGPRVVLKPLSAVVKREYRHRHSALTHAIRQALDVPLQRVTADKTKRWQPAHEAWYERQVERVLADVEAATVAGCEEDEVEALEIDTSEWGDLVSQAGLHGDAE
ncbi:unnamed protein product, partial [Prorocentrum cordatum]